MINVSVRHIATAIGLALSLPAAASAPQQPHVWAEIAPHAAIPPEAPPGPPCVGDNCVLKAIPDLWKREALKPEHKPPMNANNIILDRARFQKDVDRFGDPNASPVINYNILGSGICITGLVLHTC